MSFDCIVTQGHIPGFDPQGNVDADQKLEMFNASLAQLRKFNPDACIILTGHGVRTPDASLCDLSYWEPSCRPMSGNGYVVGMPAQFEFVDAGLSLAEEAGFKRVLKTRTDCVIQRENITAWCNEILNSESKPMLLTQQTGVGRIGDCFMYGDIGAMRKIWHKDNPVVHPDGLINTAAHFRNAFHYHHYSWLEYVREYAAFRDVVDIPFLCLRWNYHQMKANGDWDKILTGELSVDAYHWGKTNNWHAFANGIMTVNCNPAFWSKREFYG